GTGNSIHFDNTNPATAIPCAGGNDEQAFLSALQRVNAYSVSNGQLQLMDGNNVVMTFSKNAGGNGQ
ncbi:MAG TPA: META domain-containing protein, partial [Ferruginibacter sp.]|nr:META domain-containing protein [Ferruginibacter sp.]